MELLERLLFLVHDLLPRSGGGQYPTNASDVSKERRDSEPHTSRRNCDFCVSRYPRSPEVAMASRDGLEGWAVVGLQWRRCSGAKAADAGPPLDRCCWTAGDSRDKVSY
jgi:hypothetical protein